MNLSREKLIAFANEYEELQIRKKEIATDIKDYIALFCEENDIEKKKPLVKAVQAYLQWKKDRVSFLDTENAFNEFLDVLSGETIVEKISEEEL